jgi:TrmH family RNA methyltransferase
MSAAQPIISSANPRFRRLLDLSTRAASRREEGLAVIEGERLVSAWVEHSPELLVEMYLCRGVPRSDAVRSALNGLGLEAFELDPSLFARASTLENSPGPIALARMPDHDDSMPFDRDGIYLDRLQDPGNAGTILRSAAAFGVRMVLASPGTVDLWSPKVLRAGMGAHPLLEIIPNVGIDVLMARSQVPLCATSSHGGTNVSDADLGTPRIWLFGTEGSGLDLAATDSAALQWLRIDQLSGMESLNVGVAASICLHEQFRQRRRFSGIE